jgi:beta-fructofuranosidase
MTQRYNQQLGEKMDRPLANPLTHLRILIDRSSIEIFANDGDGVFSSRIFPVEGEERLVFEGQGKMEVWNLRPAIRDEFVV